MGVLNYMAANFAKKCAVFLIVVGLCSCGERDGLAPVSELNWRAGNTRATQHVVRRGETLYAIAFRFDKDYRELAAANHIYAPYSLRVGQIIRIQPGRHQTYSRPTPRYYRSPVAKPRYVQPRFIPTRSTGHWTWPARGRVVANFVPEQGKKGLDIAGVKGDKIYAAGNGTVAYSGSGLSGYGNLIIIKHDNQFLTAYGNNERNLVTEGQTIKAGQVIADMGVVDRRYWGVHFEIRQSGNPVNPLMYLQNR